MSAWLVWSLDRSFSPSNDKSSQVRRTS